MDKGELIKFLEPFDDEVKIIVTSSLFEYTTTSKLQYVPAKGEAYAYVAINTEEVGMFNTGQHG